MTITTESTFGEGSAELSQRREWLAGARAIRLDGLGQVRPDGPAHAVDDRWSTACGTGRVAYLFPGAPLAEAGDLCPACTVVLAAPVTDDADPHVA
jgi:hypothetical protein